MENYVNNGGNRILGRILAVEETKHVGGATGRDLGTGPDGGSDISLPVEDSIPCNESSSHTDTACQPNSDITPTDPLLDCNSSSTIRDICLDPA
ncbi:MAG: hypothetical protein HOP03_03925 [Lysobacter sp.]|nr:hypothetical protein [Lysobacter sp.]